MTLYDQEDRVVGYYLGFLILNVVYYVSWAMGLMDNQFAALYYIAYAALHVFNFLTDGFGVGVVFNHWRESRKFRKVIDRELA